MAAAARHFGGEHHFLRVLESVVCVLVGYAERDRLPLRSAHQRDRGSRSTEVLAAVQCGVEPRVAGLFQIREFFRAELCQVFGKGHTRPQYSPARGNFVLYLQDDELHDRRVPAAHRAMQELVEIRDVRDLFSRTGGGADRACVRVLAANDAFPATFLAACVRWAATGGPWFLEEAAGRGPAGPGCRFHFCAPLALFAAHPL